MATVHSQDTNPYKSTLISTASLSTWLLIHSLLFTRQVSLNRRTMSYSDQQQCKQVVCPPPVCPPTKCPPVCPPQKCPPPDCPPPKAYESFPSLRLLIHLTPHPLPPVRLTGISELKNHVLPQPAAMQAGCVSSTSDSSPEVSSTAVSSTKVPSIEVSSTSVA
ncbi:hypothetical protein Y1Q_0005899 [Alligator mississippiensis]|uniref:Uncharacterized protein n=1 Tax=Alligator mississippiensis TaxID=8496 RepID=A0A151M7D8_ALLMI|nr:hypothetical protein Y1Q_0005899 [Alligator mississippiensis]